MNEEPTNTHLLDALRRLYQQGRRIEQKLDTLLQRGRALNAEPPDDTYPLAEFAEFDWALIDAEVVDADAHGPTRVRWRPNGKTYTRRCPNNNFGVAIWYSRYVGMDTEGKKVYERLVRFKELERPKGLNERALAAVGGG